MKLSTQRILRNFPRLAENLRRLRERLAGYSPADRGRRAEARRVVSLAAGDEPQGTVLMSFLVTPFPDREGGSVSHHHTNQWECWRMAQTFLELGYDVDVIHFTNRRFRPQKDYRLALDVLLNLERLDPHLPAGCRRVLHADAAHWLVHGLAQHRRLLNLRERRGIALQPMKTVVPNRAIEVADCATVLGNAFTLDSFRFAGKPLLRVPISSPFLYPWPEEKDFSAARRRFLWFGSSGFVHKGLDLVLEAFAATPELHLTVCGPMAAEPEFVAAFHQELHETPNIETRGWVDVASEEFLSLTWATGSVLFPSCSEGGGGAVISCMHAGLLPVVTRQASVDVEDFGVLIEADTVEGVRQAALDVARMAEPELRDRSRRGWEHVRRHHTREAFEARYRQVAHRLLDPTPLSTPENDWEKSEPRS
jgi:glycosyltransferase involved in cell wall biosynthesis